MSKKDPLICIIGSNHYSIERFVIANRLKRQDFVIVSCVHMLRGLSDVVYIFLDGWDKSSVYPADDIIRAISRMQKGMVVELSDDIIVGENYFDLVLKRTHTPLFKSFMNLMLKRYFQGEEQ